MYVCFMHHRTCVHMKQYRRQCIGLVKAFCPKPAKVHWLLYIFSVRLASVDPNSLNWQPESSALPLHLSIYTLCINAHNSTHRLTDQFTHTHTVCVCGKNSVHVHNLHKSCVAKKKKCRSYRPVQLHHIKAQCWNITHVTPSPPYTVLRYVQH